MSDLFTFRPIAKEHSHDLDIFAGAPVGQPAAGVPATEENQRDAQALRKVPLRHEPQGKARYTEQSLQHQVTTPCIVALLQARCLGSQRSFRVRLRALFKLTHLARRAVAHDIADGAHHETQQKQGNGVGNEHAWTSSDRMRP